MRIVHILLLAWLASGQQDVTTIKRRVVQRQSTPATSLENVLPKPPSTPCQFGNTPVRFLSLRSIPDRTANMLYRLRACPQAKVHYGFLAANLTQSYDFLPRTVIMEAMNVTDSGQSEEELAKWKKELLKPNDTRLFDVWTNYSRSRKGGVGEHALLAGQMHILREMISLGVDKWVMMEDDATMNLIRLHSHTFGQIVSRDPQFGYPDWGALQMQRSPVVKWQRIVSEHDILQDQISTKTSYGAVMMVMSRGEAIKRLKPVTTAEDLKHVVALGDENAKLKTKKPLKKTLTRIACSDHCVWDIYGFGSERTTYFPYPDWATQGSSAETAHVRGVARDFWDRHEWVRLSAIDSARYHFELLQYLSAIIAAASAEDFFAGEMLTSLVRTRWSRQHVLLELIWSVLRSSVGTKLRVEPRNSLRDLVMWFHQAPQLPNMGHQHLKEL